MSRSRTIFARQPKFLKWSILAIICFVLIGGFIVYFSRAATPTSYSYNFQTNQPSGRIFTADSPINQPVPSDARYKSDAGDRLQTLQGGALLSLLQWSVPVFDVDSSVPQESVWCLKSDPNASWDTCNGLNKRLVPVPKGVFAQRGGDGHVTVIDHSNRQIYSYWIWKPCATALWGWAAASTPNNAKWCPDSGNVASIDGNGVGGGTDVAGLAGGMIRTYEVEQGVIDHALMFAPANTCTQSTAMYYPASHADGSDTSSSCIPIGARFQLDPSINLDIIPNITPLEKMIGKALQKYGAYCDDTGGAFGFSIEFDRTGRNVYYKAGAPKPDSDAVFLRALPWTQLRMVEPQWTSTGSKAYNWTTPSSSASTPVATPTPVISKSPTPVPATPTPTPVKTPTPVPATPTPTPVKSTTPTPSAGSTSNPTLPTKPAVTSRTINFDWLKGGWYIELKWNASVGGNGIQDYTITRNGAANRATTATSFQDSSGLSANVSYVYEVTARGKNGKLSEAAKVGATTRCALLWCWLE